MHLDAQDELDFAEILDAVLAFEAVLDPLDLVEVRRDEEEVVNVEGNVVRVPPLAADVDAGAPHYTPPTLSYLIFLPH
jgi:hypothetical protein